MKVSTIQQIMKIKMWLGIKLIVVEIMDFIISPSEAQKMLATGFMKTLSDPSI
jgi:hypothetical protein